MSSLYTIGQMNQHADALEMAGYTPQHVQILGQAGRLEAMKKVLDGDAEIVMKPKTNLASKPEPFLRLISGGRKLTIHACKGNRTIAKSEALFTGYLDRDFINYGLDVKGVKTLDTDVEVHEMVKDGTFAEIYASMNTELDKLCFTQDQIITFVETQREWLRTDGYGTFFLMKKGNKFFVASVRVGGRGLSVSVRRFSHGHVWSADHRHRFVIPQLTA